MKREEYRDRLISWWQSLTDEQKMVLPTSNNTIDLRDLFSDAPISYYIIRRNLKEDVKKIEAELKALGVLSDIDAYRERLLNWWQLLTDDQKKEVPTVNNTIDLRDLFDGVPLSYGSIRQYLQEDIKKIEVELKALDVLSDVEGYKERLLSWWGSLTDEQKKALPTVKNTIDLRDLFDDAPIGYAAIRQYLKEEISKIDAELKALGAFFDVEICRKRLLNWWGALTEEQKKALPTVNNTIDLRDFFSDAPISYYTIRKNLKEDVKKIDAELKALDVLFDVEAYRDRLINWWVALTDEQKKALPTASNSIDLRDLFDGVPLKYASIRQYLQEDINKIDAELKALGILSDVEAYRKRLINWWQSLTDAQKKVVPTTNNTIDFSDLFSDAPISYHTIRKNLKKDVKKIDTELKSLNILFDCEAYRKLLNNWWKSLTDDQKKEVKTFRNKIDLHFLFSGAPISYVRVRSLLKEDIDKIEEELKLLCVLFNDDDDVITTLMCDFISECEANPDLLWDVEFSTIHRPKRSDQEVDHFFEQYGLVSKVYLANKLSCTSKSLDKPALLDLRKQLNQLLLEYEVSFPYSKIKDSKRSVSYDLNHRRIFLKWKNSLTEEEKLALPIIGKTIEQKAFSDLIPPERKASRYPLFKAEYQRFSSEILELKGINYKTKKEREEIRKEKALGKAESKMLVFSKLRDKRLVSIEDFSSEKGRYEDVQHAFAVGSLKATSKSGISNYYNGYKYYSDLLESKGVSPNSSFIECFYSWSLRDFKEYLGDKIGDAALSTASSTTILSTLRMTLDRLKTIRNFDFNYLPADGFEIVRESLAYKPYSPNERKQIHEMLEQEVALAKKKIDQYKKLDRKSANLDNPKIQARIIFEDDCNCIPPYHGHWAAKFRTKGQNKLIHFVASRRLSLVELYDEWGVLTRQLTSREVGVYVLKMAQVLGMNLNSILDLELDDYQEHHPLTNKPCLTYWKERSTGEKMLHLDLFHADLQWLTISQKHFVETVFDEVTCLTSEVRKYAPDETSNRLFITFYKKVTTITENTMCHLYSELIEGYQLKDDNGEPLILTTTRFRPTLVSELIEAGVSIREIQYMLGHSSLFTTIGYIERLEFDRIIRDKARKAIEDIYSNTVHASEQDSSKKQPRRFDKNQIIMETPLGGCKNIFDPPDFIKKSSFYVKGKPCSQYNKCISCGNVMLTEKHLPELFAMQRDYLATLESSKVFNTPYHVVVLENLSLLDDILNPETSEFEEDILIQAKEDSLFIETTILDNWGR